MNGLSSAASASPAHAIRTAIVTGGARGIGEAVARELAADSIHVVIAARDRERGEKLAARLSREFCASKYVHTDVTSSESVRGCIDSVVREFGAIDILINNSGIEPAEDLDGPSEADWDRMFDTNVRGTWLACKAAIPSLLLSDGVIVNIASMAGLVGVAGGVGYAASKAAVVSMTKSLALGYADRGLRVNAVCPGPVNTQMTLDEWARAGGREPGYRQAMSMSPARRITQPEEVAGLVGYLASPRALSITGAIITIDGAKTAGLMQPSRYAS